MRASSLSPCPVEPVPLLTALFRSPSPGSWIDGVHSVAWMSAPKSPISPPELRRSSSHVQAGKHEYWYCGRKEQPSEERGFQTLEARKLLKSEGRPIGELVRRHCHLDSWRRRVDAAERALGAGCDDDKYSKVEEMQPHRRLAKHVRADDESQARDIIPLLPDSSCTLTRACLSLDKHIDRACELPLVAPAHGGAP